MVLLNFVIHGCYVAVMWLLRRTAQRGEVPVPSQAGNSRMRFFLYADTPVRTNWVNRLVKRVER